MHPCHRGDTADKLKHKGVDQWNQNDMFQSRQIAVGKIAHSGRTNRNANKKLAINQKKTTKQTKQNKKTHLQATQAQQERYNRCHGNEYLRISDESLE